MLGTLKIHIIYSQRHVTNITMQNNGCAGILAINI